MNKFLMLSLFGILAVGVLVSAGYIYNNFVIKSDVYESFSVEYAIVGDGSTWDGVTDCTAKGLVYTAYPNGQEVDMVGLYAGEGRLACARITNLAEADVNYTFSYSITDNEGNHDACVSAFGENSVSGVALASIQTTAEIPIIVSDSATPVNDCLISVVAERG
jgi:hypothetical protein